MSKRPHKNIPSNKGQKGVYQCKNCKEIFMDSPKGVNSKDFCCKRCEERYEKRQKPDIDESPLDGNKDILR